MFRTSLLTAGAAAVMLCALTGVSLAKSDKAFLKGAIRGDNSEIRLGQLATKQGSSEGVRSFGQTLVADHGRAKDSAVAVATQMGLKTPKGMKKDAKAEMEKLKGLSGPAFDNEFASFMVDDHKKEIAVFQEEAAGTGAAADLAKATLPDLQKHLDMATKLAAS